MNAYKFIKQNGLDKAREIVAGAPDGATDFVLWTGKVRYINSKTDEIHSEKYGGWCEANQMVLNLKNSLVELRQAIADYELVESLGGIEVCKKITFQKRLHKPNATHFSQHPEKRNLVQFYLKNASKPKNAIRFDVLEPAIQRIGGVFDHHPLPEKRIEAGEEV